MSTAEKYVTPTDVTETWNVETTGAARFSWEYDDGRARLLSLYQKGKDKQWDSTKRIDWSLDVDINNPVGLPDGYNPFIGTDIWDNADSFRYVYKMMSGDFDTRTTEDRSSAGSYCIDLYMSLFSAAGAGVENRKV